MNKQTQSESESEFDLYLLMSKVNHALNLARQKELSQYDTTTRQTHVLRVIKSLGSKATLFEVAKQVDREVPVISKQTIRMENDGLIKRIKYKSKSNLLKLQLTKKGAKMVEISEKSHLVHDILSFLTKEDRQKLEILFNTILTRVNEYHSIDP
jgi:DNA-binding MarR family transcriptional regulator